MNAFEWTVAWRFLREGRMQTLLILIGVTVGVAVVIFITALINGLQSNIIKRTLSSQAHIVVRPPDHVSTPSLVLAGGSRFARKVEQRTQAVSAVEQWQAVQTLLDDQPEITAVSPLATGAAFAYKGEASKAVVIMGVEPERYQRIVDVPGNMKEGRFAVESGGAVIGIELADDLGLKIGDKLRLQASGNRSDVFHVAGIFDLGVRDLNRRWIYLNLKTAQSLLDMPGSASNLDLKVSRLFGADDIAARIQALTGLKAESWMQTNAQLMTALRSQTTSTTIIRVFVSISVAFAIASVLAVSVVQKSREIGILRAMGTPSGSVLRIFLIQGGLVGMAGSLLGGGFAALLLKVFTTVAKGPDGLPFVTVEVSPALYINAAVVALITGLLAAAAPALRAARLDPTQAIRNG